MDLVPRLRAVMEEIERGYKGYQRERIWLWAVAGILMAIVFRGYYLTIRYLPASIRHARAMREQAFRVQVRGSCCTARVQRG